MKKLLLLLSILMTATVSTPAQQAPAQVTPTNPAGNCVDLPSLEKKVEDMNDRLKDWPQLARYREANTTLKPPTKDEPRVVFMGDSITDIWQYPQFGGFFPGKPYIDRGIGGQTTPQMLLRFRPDVIALQPRVVVILAGTNDIAGNTGPMTLEETEGHLASMSELAHAHGIRVVLASVTPVNDITTLEGKKITQTTRRPPEKILSLNEWIKRYAADHGDVYLDYFPAMIDEKGMLKPDLTNDGLHPNAAGYAVMAPLAEKAIQQSLSQKP
ncbi:MAG: SGNH/GDSL hydrolase family protein [Candidatus Acidiferrum sp.]|jgi:lysophospholipase L1-like esterase